MNSPKRLPAVTLLLIAANMVAAFALVLDPDLIQEFGFRAANPSLRSAFTSLFLHANVLHLLGNMIFLAAVCAAVELSTGSLRFGLVYLGSGLAGILLHWAVVHSSPMAAPYIGASGAIAGCAGYYCVRYTRLKVPLAPHVGISVAWVTAAWAVLQVVGGFVHIGETGGTAFWAHLGGLAAGLLASAVFRTPDLGQIKLGHEVLDQMNERSPVAAAAAARKHLEKIPNDIRALEDLARACEQMDDVDGEADVILRLLELQSISQQAILLGRLIELDRIDLLNTHRRLLFADLVRSDSPNLAKALLKSVIEGSPNDSQRPEAILALIGMERNDEPARAQILLDELLSSYPLHPCADLARKRGWVA